ncbi:MAG TPA: TolC family protein [Chthoniobacterales bacterium]
MNLLNALMYFFPLTLLPWGTLASETAGMPQRREGGPTLSLEAVLQAVNTVNPSVQEARARWDAAKRRVPQAAAWEDPKFSFNSRLGRFVNIAPDGFTDQMVGVEQMIPVSGKNRSKARVAAAEALGAFEQVRRHQLDAVAKAKASYFRLVNLRALLDFNRRDEGLLGQTLGNSREKFEVGGVSQGDVLTAETELEKVHEARQDLEQQVSSEETALRVLMNRDPFLPLGYPSTPGPEGVDLPLEKLRALVLTNRPEVRMAQAHVTASLAKVEFARREWIPDPTVSLQAQRYNEASQAVSEVSGGVSVNLPWFNGQKYRAEQREAESETAAAQSAFQNAQLEGLGLLRDQLAKIRTSSHHVELYRDRLLPTARRALEANRAGYASNTATFLGLVTSEQDLRSLEATYQQHRSDYQTALAGLEAIVGADLRLAGVSRPPGGHHAP